MKFPTPQYRCPSGACNPRPPIWTPSRNVAGATSTSWWSTRPTNVWTSSSARFVRRIGERLYGRGRAMAEWTIDRTWRPASRRPPAPDDACPRACAGLLQHWPAIVRKEWETFAADEHVYRPFPPTPDAIDRMLETMRWVQWLEVEQRHLVWMRAKRYGWRDITIRFACDRTTAWRRWQRALEIVADQLNSEGIVRPFVAN